MVGVSRPRAAALEAAGAVIPPPVAIDFLIDTGASSTVVDEAAIAPLSLPPTGQAHVRTPTTGEAAESRWLYDVGLMLYQADNSRMFNSLAVIATNLGVQGIGGLLGRDVLQSCLLVYDGTAGTYSLAF